uniref:Taste receptor type 2 n=1 Tax=Pygocentrus nattereri TaxID=42514 RepID=A0AAR2IM81_PYGNA
MFLQFSRIKYKNNTKICDYFCFEMSGEAFGSVNVPVSVFSLILNIIFVFCLLFPHRGTKRLKQPLNILLGSLVGSNIAAHICILVMVVYNFLSPTSIKSLIIWWLVPVIAVYTMMISVNSSHWLNVFYCFQILPVQRPSFIWLKRNIRIFMYSALVFSVVVCLLGMSVNTAGIFILYENTTENQTDWRGLDNAWSAVFWMTLGLFCLSLCVMLVSSCATLVFLWRHMKNMEKSSSPVSSPHRQRQIRVTIISIAVQAVLHIICSALVVLDEIIIDISPWYLHHRLSVLFGDHR